MRKIQNRIYNISKKKKLIYIPLILFIGFYLRIYDINWDSAHYFHPDERAIYMFTVPLEYPDSFAEFLSPHSPLNPNFFAYGNFPIYLLKLISDLLLLFDIQSAGYGGIHIIGRSINAIVGTFTIFLVYLLAKRLFNSIVGLLGAFFYSIAVFPIQNSHFYTVDTLLTFFILSTLLFVDFYIDKQKIRYAALIGLSVGLALATKISALPILLVVFAGFLIAYLKKKRRIDSKLLLSHFLNFMIFFLVCVIVFFATQPYVLIDFRNFFEQVLIQSKMGSDPFIFPYTLQYVGKIPIIYEFKNIFLWGLGIPLSMLAFSGLLLITTKTVVNYKNAYRILPMIIFFWIYFLLSSSYAVGWMRYLLPIYPILTILGAAFSIRILFDYFSRLLKLEKKIILRKTLLLVFLIICSLWSLSFMTIYTKQDIRIEASEWINQNIPAGSTLATEHWDDTLPVFGQDRYHMLSLPLYEPDTETKWQGINSMLESADYIIIASNRLHIPLRKLTDCDNLPPGRCFTMTAKYYNDLFSGNSNFQKVAEFNSFPQIPILNIEINDQSADESFTVIDHPEIFIFQKIR